MIPRRLHEGFADHRLTANKLFSRKGHEIVAMWFFNENILVALIAAQWAILFFVRVNQVLVRLWTRAIGSVRGDVVGFPTTDHRQPATDSVVRLMSDRESCVMWRHMTKTPQGRTASVQRRRVN